MTWVLDLDGVVWRGATPIEGSVEAIATLQRNNIPVRYVTNNASMSNAEFVQKMHGMGITTAQEDVLSSRALLFELLGGNSTVLCANRQALSEAIAAEGNKVFQ